MKVLHLPQNIASQVSVTVQALRQIGVDARGIVYDQGPLQNSTGLEIIQHPSRRKQPIRGTLRKWRNTKNILAAIEWADIVHWHFTWALPDAHDVCQATRLGKPCLVEFWGSDIRVPRIAAADNPFCKSLFSDNPHLSNSSELRSAQTQKRFAELGVNCLIPSHELMAHVDKALFPQPLRTRQRLLLSQFTPRFPPPRPEASIAHSHAIEPSKKGYERCQTSHRIAPSLPLL
jgi:hypothetical protein